MSIISLVVQSRSVYTDCYNNISLSALLHRDKEYISIDSDMLQIKKTSHIKDKQCTIKHVIQ